MLSGDSQYRCRHRTQPSLCSLLDVGEHKALHMDLFARRDEPGDVGRLQEAILGNIDAGYVGWTTGYEVVEQTTSDNPNLHSQAQQYPVPEGIHHRPPLPFLLPLAYSGRLDPLLPF